MSNIVRLRPASHKVKLRNNMKNEKEVELTYQIVKLSEKVDDLEKDMAIANKMIRLLTLLLVSEKDGVEELLKASKELV